MPVESLKVGYIVKMFPRLSETFILNEILELERSGIEVTIFSLKRPNEGIFHPQLAKLKAEALYLDEFDLRKWPAWLGQQWEALRPRQEHFWSLLDEALRDCDRARTDQILLSAWIASQALSRGIHRLHAHFATAPSALAYYASRISGIDFSFTAHAKDIYVYPFTETLMREKIAAAAQLITVTEFNKKYIAERCPEKLRDRVVVLHNGIDLREFSPGEGDSNSQPEEGLIVAVGRLVPKKGFDTLLHACATLKARNVKFRCVIIGDGAERDSLRAIQKEENLCDVVDLHGPAHSGNTRTWIQRATVTCLPCTTAPDNNVDALPTSLLESIACGVPVVSTAISGIPEIVESGKEGFLVAPDNPADLANKLELLLKDERLRESFALNCRKKAEREFDIRKNVRRLAQLFSTSLKRVSADIAADTASSTRGPEAVTQHRQA